MSNVVRRQRRGFTLVEIVVVVAIAGLLTVAAIPMLRNVGSSSSRSLRDTAQTLRQYLRSARTYAIENRVKAAVCYVQVSRWVDPDGLRSESDEFLEGGTEENWWTGYVLVYEDPKDVWHRFRGGPLAQRITMEDPIRIQGDMSNLRMVKVVTTAEDEPILGAFRDPDRPSDIPFYAVMGYSAFRPSGMGTMHIGGLGGRWIPLAGRSVVRLYDDRVTEQNHVSVNIVNSTGAVKVKLERSV